MKISFLTAIAFCVSTVAAIYCEQHEVDATFFWIIVMLSGIELITSK